MKKYKVIPIACHGLGNKVYASGAVVTEKNFPEGNVAKLVEEGFLRELTAEEYAEHGGAPTTGPVQFELVIDEEATIAKAIAHLKEKYPDVTDEQWAVCKYKMQNPDVTDEQLQEMFPGVEVFNPPAEAANAKQPIESFTVPALKEYLTGKQVAFNKNDNKTQLYALYLAN